MYMLMTEEDNYVFIDAVESALAFLIIIHLKITHNLWKDVSI